MTHRSPRRIVATALALVVTLAVAASAAGFGSAAADSGRPTPSDDDRVPDLTAEMTHRPPIKPTANRPAAAAVPPAGAVSFVPPAAAQAAPSDAIDPSEATEDPTGLRPTPPIGLTGVSAGVPALSDAWLEGIIDQLAEAAATPEPAYDPWAAVRQCESTGNYATNTGNGFYGAYQFTSSTWNWVASQVLPAYVGVRPDLAPSWAQDRIAQALAFEVAGGGLHHWPVCGQLYGS